MVILDPSHALGYRGESPPLGEQPNKGRLSHCNARTAEQTDGSVSRSVGRSTSLLGATRSKRNHSRPRASMAH
jgi:hypothetical protein